MHALPIAPVFHFCNWGDNYLFFLLANTTHMQLNQLNSQKHHSIVFTQFGPPKAVIKIFHNNGCIYKLHHYLLFNMMIYKEWVQSCCQNNCRKQVLLHLPEGDIHLVTWPCVRASKLAVRNSCVPPSTVVQNHWWYCERGKILYRNGENIVS